MLTPPDLILGTVTQVSRKRKRSDDNIDIENLIIAIRSAPLDQISSILHTNLTPLSASSTRLRLDTTLSILDRMLSDCEDATATISTIWQYIEETHIWEPHYSTLIEFKESISYDDVIQPILTTSATEYARKANLTRHIESAWGKPLNQLFGSKLTPKRFSHLLIRELANLSKIRPIFDEAFALLKSEVRACWKSQTTLSKSNTILATDVKAVLARIQRSTSVCEMVTNLTIADNPSQGETIVDTMISLVLHAILSLYQIPVPWTNQVHMNRAQTNQNLPHF